MSCTWNEDKDAGNVKGCLKLGMSRTGGFIAFSSSCIALDDARVDSAQERRLSKEGETISNILRRLTRVGRMTIGRQYTACPVRSL
jgi:hypothetical protein